MVATIFYGILVIQSQSFPILKPVARQIIIIGFRLFAKAIKAEIGAQFYVYNTETIRIAVNSCQVPIIMMMTKVANCMEIKLGKNNIYFSKMARTFVLSRFSQRV